MLKERKAEPESAPSTESELALWEDEMDHLMERAWRGFGFRPLPRFLLWPGFDRTLRDGQWLPEVDVVQEEGKLLVKADLPGVKPENIEVVVEGGLLIIRGKREETKESAGKAYQRTERARGEFYRAISLPDGVKAEAVTASYKDGVLEVTALMPEAPASKKVRIQVK